MGVMLTIIKALSSYSYSSYGNRGHPGNFQNKSSVNSPSIEFPDMKEGTTLWDYLQEHLVDIRDEKVSFCEI